MISTDGGQRILRSLRFYAAWPQCKNELYFAFRELGRVVRTIFLLQYVSDLELRQVMPLL